MSNNKLLGVDIAKHVFHFHGVDEKGHCVMTKKVNRKMFLETLLQTDCETIVMEACGGANHWARELKKQGRAVKLISPQFVKPFVKRNKNDYKDAEAICEAASRPNMNFVEPLTEERQDIQSIHRVRQGLIDARTACSNRIRGLLAEYGEVVSLGIHKLMAEVTELLSDNTEQKNGLTPLLKQLLSSELELLKDYTKRIKDCDVMLKSTCEQNDICQRLSEMPGIGIVNATILYVKLGTGLAFKNGRHFAAYLGLTPKQHSSGGKEVLLGISKQGDGYVRRNLVHGARSILRLVSKRTDSLSQWAMKLTCKKKSNVVCVAVANKLARIAWSVVKENKKFELNPVLKVS